MSSGTMDSFSGAGSAYASRWDFVHNCFTSEYVISVGSMTSTVKEFERVFVLRASQTCLLVRINVSEITCGSPHGASSGSFRPEL